MPTVMGPARLMKYPLVQAIWIQQLNWINPLTFISRVARIAARLIVTVAACHQRRALRKAIDEQGKLTADLRAQIESCFELTVLEDIYLPFRPKRRTRATIAREKGLEPLAQKIFAQEDMDPPGMSPGRCHDVEKSVTVDICHIHIPVYV